MNIDIVAAQLRTYATIFNGQVAGAAGYANGVQDQVWLPLPAAYVIPGEEDADPNESQTGTYQIVHERVSIVVVLSTPNAGGEPDKADRRAQAAAAQLRLIRASIFKALLNWQPDPDGIDTTTQIEGRAIYYLGAGFPADGAFDRARFFYRYDFGLDTTITDDDGWRPTGAPLVDVKATITNPAGSSARTLRTSSAQFAPGETLQFAPGALAGLWIGAAASGSGISPGAIVTGLNNGIGSATLSLPTTTAVPSGTPILFDTVLAVAAQAV